MLASRFYFSQFGFVPCLQTDLYPRDEPGEPTMLVGRVRTVEAALRTVDSLKGQTLGGFPCDLMKIVGVAQDLSANRTGDTVPFCTGVR